MPVTSRRPRGESGNKHEPCPPRVYNLEASGACRKLLVQSFVFCFSTAPCDRWISTHAPSMISQETLQASPVVQPLWGQAALEDQGWLRSLQNITIIKVIGGIYSMLIMCWVQGWTIFLGAPLRTILFLLFIVTSPAPRTGLTHSNCLRKIC